MKKRKHTRRIIFHHSMADSSSAEMIKTWHTMPPPDGNGWKDIGYHFVVRRSGVKEDGRDIKAVGSHALGRNGDSIGICIEGDLRRYEPTMAQLNECAALVHSICRYYGRSLKVEFHRPHIFNLFEPNSYNRFNACPGSMLNRADFLECMRRADPYYIAHNEAVRDIPGDTRTTLQTALLSSSV